MQGSRIRLYKVVRERICYIEYDNESREICMKLQYLRAFIVLLAGLVALIVNMKTGKPVTLSLLIVLIVILIFYVIGTLVVEILQKNLENDETNETMEGNQDVENEATEDEQKDEEIAFAFDEDEAE